MYELSRVRLHTVGPKGARYRDITLDLRGVGVLSGAVPRPSPATVLFLENGGGKTVLVKLIFSVMLPGRRQVVGTSSTRVLEKFVLADDVAHVALEWQDPKTGQVLVIGKASEWRGHVVSADPNRLTERWYSFRPTPSLSLDTLPFTDDGRPVTLSGFHDRLSERDRVEPAVRVVWEKNHGDWTAHLQDLQLDPELFSYQRKMNAGEGEAADAFTFKTDDAFVDWLLTAITPDEDPGGLGELVIGYAEKLAMREELLAERDFVGGALDRLGPLARAAKELATAMEMEREARSDAEQLVSALVAREAEEGERHRLLKEQLEAAVGQERSADQDMRRLNSIVLELNRLVAKLRWEEATRERQRLEEERDDARKLLAAWVATEAIVRYQTAQAEAGQVRKLVREQKAAAEPVLRERDAAAKRLARGLLAVAWAADGAAADADEQAAALEEHISQAEQDQRDKIGEAEAAKATIDQLKKSIAATQDAIRAAVAAGLLDDDADVVASATTAEEAASQAETVLQEALTRAQDLATDREEAGSELEDLRADLRQKSSTKQALAEQLKRALQLADELCESGRLADLLGTEDVILDNDAEAVVELLDGAVEVVVTEQARLRQETEVDGRILEALGSGGLLPPGDDIAAALSILHGSDIIAWSGWQYLASIRADERDQVLARYPYLVDGIVLNSGDDLGLARDELTAARLLPQTVIAVGTTAAISDLGSEEPAGLGFIVPPNPAMYDAAQAELERQEIQRRQSARSGQLAWLASAIESDRDLTVRLRTWRRDYPSGRLATLMAEHDRAESELREARERERKQSEFRTGLVNAEKELRRRLPGFNSEAWSARKRADKLVSLAAEHAKVSSWQEEIRIARTDVTQAEKDAMRARDRAGELRRRQSEFLREADGHRRTADACREQLGAVPGGGSVDEAMPVPDEPIQVLRAAYESLVLAYERADVGTDLRAELSRVDSAESKAREAVEHIERPVREQAEALLRMPDGTDAAARAAATARTRRLAEALEAQVTRAAGEEGEWKREYESIQRQERSLEPYGRPRDIQHGEQLIAAAIDDREKARRNLEDIQDRKAALETEVTTTDRKVSAFSSVKESLGAIVSLEDVQPAEPFPGTVEAARARRDKVRENVGTATRLLDGAREQVRHAADALAKHADDDRYEKVTAPVRRQMIAVGRERLPDFAAEWEQALRPRLRVLSDELDQIERHRAAIITRLKGMVTYALGRLRAAQRASRLPDGLGDWSGLEFLRIAFAQPDDAVLDERIGQVIDEATGSEGASGRRDGLSLLLAGVRAALRPKGVRVDMLKPDAVLRDERVRVSEIGDVFSGGQLLTAAIILYCTMASLRASERGQARHQHAGVLFLDNPIGRASAGYLLELQLAVAEKLQVQLVYTTGLFDMNALSVFPLIIRLRNDADLRAGMKYLSVDSAIRSKLPAEPADDTGVLTASRLYVRPSA
jgi:hypothetical protein